MTPKNKNILHGIVIPLLAILACAVIGHCLAGCSTLWNDETAAAVAEKAAPAIQKLAGTDKLAAKFDAAAEQQQLSYAFTWLTAEKQGITETDARDWLARQNAGSGDAAPPEEDSGVDAVDFALLKWEYGGHDGSNAKLDQPRLSGLKASSGSISYKWDVGLSAWGLDDDNAGALACLFVERADGTIAGGKFDWVSTSRKSRGLENIVEGYGGWSLDGVPNPCKVYYVVTDVLGRRRSNVVSTEWSR